MEGSYSVSEMKFEKGDVFVYYTDGVTEATNSKLELYGKERLTTIIEANLNFGAKEILEAIAKDVRKFEPKAGQHDDITLVVVKII